MKKFTRLAVFVLILTGLQSFAARPGTPAIQVKENAQAIGQSASNQQNAVTPFYTEDFASGLPSGWTAVDSAGNGVNWHYTTTGIFNQVDYPGLDSLSHTGTSAANGYMVYDSDSAAQSVGGENADLISDAIDCSANSNVHLTFNHMLVHFQETAKVYVSNDGTTWTEVYDATTGLNAFEATPNPTAVDVDITSVAAGEATVYIRFNFTGDYDFWWMVDDVSLYEQAGTDGQMLSIDAPANSCTLLGATEPVTVTIFNAGSQDLTNFDVTFILDAGTPVTEIVTDTVFSGSSHAYTFTATADVSAPGAHTISAYLSIAGDTNLVNDSAAAQISNGAMQVNTTDSYSMGFEDNEDISGWLTEDLNADSITWVISNLLPRTGVNCARIGSPTADDYLFTTCLELIDTLVYDLDFWYRNTATSTQSNLEVMIGTAQNSTAMTQTIIPFSQITSLAYIPASAQFTVPATGIYYIGFHVVTSDSAVGLRIDDVMLTAATGTGISGNAFEGSVTMYPNPTSGILTINGSNIASADYTVDIMNTVGQVVISSKHSGLNNVRFDLNDQPSGIYLVRITSAEGVYTKQINLIR